MIAWPAAPTNGAASVSALPAGLNMPARGSAGGIAASSRPGGDGTNPGSARDVQMKDGVIEKGARQLSFRTNSARNNADAGNAYS
jgi:hypothetical protein